MDYRKVAPIFAALFASLLLLSRASAAASALVTAASPTAAASIAHGAPPPAGPATRPDVPTAGSSVYLPLIARAYVPGRFPNDPYYGYQWGLPKVNAPQAWGYSTGAGVVIAIVDTGVDLSHPDLAGKIAGGYNFVANNYFPQDDNGHGTHVAGIAAAMTNNTIGVAGLGWDAQIMPIKVLDSYGSGSSVDVADGIIWAADHGARVINLSLGGDQFSQTLLNATNYAYTKGALVVAASGNCGDPTTYSSNGCAYFNPTIYPAANPNVLGVGATTASDTRASFSSYGYWVDVTAPGDQIFSTLVNGYYGYKSGTSMASPLVAGLASLVWAPKPALTNNQVANVIMTTAVDLGPVGWDDQYGYGRIDAAAALASVSSMAAARAANLDKPVTRTASTNAPIRPGILLLRWKSGTRAADRQAAIAARGLRVVREIKGIGVQAVSVPVGQERALAAQMAADPSVEYAEPDYLVHAF